MLHVSFYIPHFLCFCMLPYVLGFVRSCIVLVLMQDILTFMCLNTLVILRLDLNVFQIIVSLTVLLSRLQLLCLCCNWGFSLWVV